MGKALVTCNECGFEWYGRSSADALRTVGCCTRCRGDLSFNDEPSADTVLEPALDVPAHLVLGTPRY